MSAVVRIAQGELAGKKSAGGVLSFKGIPYAQPPVGALRWRPPQLDLGWVGTRLAHAFGPACPQPLMPRNSLVNGGEGAMSEDCLYLNIWTNGLDPAEKRPVIVWLHLGGFMMGWSGAPLYDGGALAREGVVVVTVNYRLGRFGFLAHPALSAESASGTSGNYGLLDQIAALQWVQENIASFGGDPGCVTIYGVSAGAYSASALMASPLAKGLFHRAIGGSGGAFGPAGASSEAGDYLQTLASAEMLGAELMTGAGAEDAAAMRRLSSEQVLTAKIPQFWLARRGLLDTTYPILDGHVLPATPYDVFLSGNQHNVPVITGSNTDESSIVPFNQDSATWVEDTRAVFGKLYERFAELFPAGQDGQTSRSSAGANADRLFTWQNWAWAHLHAKTGNAPVFYYRFTHEPPVPPGIAAEQSLNENVGAFHSAELPYVFRNLAARDWPWTVADRQLCDAMSRYWLNFARTGNPNGRELPQWLPFESTKKAMMIFAESALPGYAETSERMAFWDAFYTEARHADRRRHPPADGDMQRRESISA